jgi:hypothetical protein
MIIKDHLDRGVGRIGGIEKLKELDELAAAMAIFDQGVDFASDKVNACQQTERAVALILKIAREARVHARLGQQVRRRRCDRLDAGLRRRR